MAANTVPARELPSTVTLDRHQLEMLGGVLGDAIRELMRVHQALATMLGQEPPVYEHDWADR